MAISFDRVNRFVLITSPQTNVTIQDIYDACKDYEDEPGNLDLGELCEAFGKQDLGGGVQVGITLVMLNRWRIKFEDRPGPDTEQMRISGGNLVAGYEGSPDYNQNPVAPSTFTQVITQASSSATLLNQEDLIFGGEVWLDTVAGFVGTEFPNGTESQPALTLTDALTIANERNYRRFKATGPLTWNIAGQSSTEWDGYGVCTFSFASGADAHGVLFTDMFFVGGDAGMDTSPHGEECRIRDSFFSGTLTGIHGFIRTSAFQAATIQPVGGKLTLLDDCASATGGETAGLTLDLSQPGASNVNLRKYAGGVVVSGMADATANLTIDGNGIKVTIDSGCVAGTIVIRGEGLVVDNSAGATVIKVAFTEGFKVDETHKLHGLDLANPLVVDNANDKRTVGSGSPHEIEQDVTTVGNVTTVTRVK